MEKKRFLSGIARMMGGGSTHARIFWPFFPPCFPLYFDINIMLFDTFWSFLTPKSSKVPKLWSQLSLTSLSSDRNTHSCKWTAVFICYPIRTAYSIFFFTFFFFTYRTWSLWRWLNIPPWQYHNSYLGLAVYRVAKVEGLQDWRSTKG